MVRLALPGAIGNLWPHDDLSRMKVDVYADLAHLFMLNFSVPADALADLVPAPLRLHILRGRGFPSIVLPKIERLRPVLTRFPRVDYELYGLRILVEYDSEQLGPIKGIYFAELIMDPDPVRMAANFFTDFQFSEGTVRKRNVGSDTVEVEVRNADRERWVSGSLTRTGEFPRSLTENSSFESPEEALATYNDIAYGFLPARDRIHVLQIADPHPNYVAWPLEDLMAREVWIDALHGDPQILESGVTAEPAYYVGPIPRYWRWLETEPRVTAEQH